VREVASPYLARGENLLLPMLTGWKKVPAKFREPPSAEMWAFAIRMIIAVALFLSLLKLSAHG
jgi:hypothetical protein